MQDYLDIVGTGTVPMRGPYADIREMMRANRDAGGYYFSAEALRYFQARQHDCISGRLLVESVRNGDAPRRYRVRAMIDGQPHTPIGGDSAGGNGFSTLRAARAFAHGIAGNLPHDPKLIERLRDDVAAYLTVAFPNYDTYSHGEIVNVSWCRIKIGESYAEITHRFSRLGGASGRYTILLDNPTHAMIADAVRTLLAGGTTAAAAAIGAST